MEVMEIEMNEIRELEKEVAALRTLLAEKESRLLQLKRNWTPEQVNESGEGSEPDYTEPRPVTSVTVNVDPHKTHPPAQIGEQLPKWAIERYSRQILLPTVRAEGQARVCKARVAVVGAGGLGCPAAVYLAGAGFGTIGIVDYDAVELTNLHRQILHTEDKQGMNKADSVAEALRKLNSRVNVQVHKVQISSDNAMKILSDYDIVLDCTDNMPTRYLLNDACVLLKIPLISGSALKLDGQLTIYGYREPKTDKEQYIGPCYRCLFPAPAPAETVGSCSAQGVLGPVPGAVGALQALEAVKMAAGRPSDELLVGRMLLFDGEDCSFRTVKLRSRNPECPVCSDNASVTQLLDYEQFCQARAKEKKIEERRLKLLRRQEEKEKRMSGRAYFGFRKSLGETKEKWVQDVPKDERKLGPTCDSEYCAKGIPRKCSDFSEEMRKNIFEEFWDRMDWKAKRCYVKSLVDFAPPRRRRSKHKGEVSRKGDSKIYHLFNKTDRVQVCRKMFLNSLGIKEAMVRCWLNYEESKPKLPKKKPIKSQSVGSYLDSLPKFLPKCPECRGSVNVFYLDESIKNRQQLYKQYVRDATSSGVTPASRKTFAKVFAGKNLGLFKPKNDGDTCSLFSEHNVKKGADVEIDATQKDVVYLYYNQEENVVYSQW